MNNNCEYTKSVGCCLCDACQAMAKALQETENIPQEDIDKMFSELSNLVEKALEE